MRHCGQLFVALQSRFQAGTVCKGQEWHAKPPHRYDRRPPETGQDRCSAEDVQRRAKMYGPAVRRKGER